MPEAWKGRYPYQVRVKILDEIIKIPHADKILKKFEVRRNTPLYGKKLLDFLDLFIPNTPLLDSIEPKNNETIRLILKEKEKVKKHLNEKDIEDEIPLIESTTLISRDKAMVLLPKGITNILELHLH